MQPCSNSSLKTSATAAGAVLVVLGGAALITGIVLHVLNKAPISPSALMGSGSALVVGGVLILAIKRYVDSKSPSYIEKPSKTEVSEEPDLTYSEQQAHYKKKYQKKKDADDVSFLSIRTNQDKKASKSDAKKPEVPLVDAKGIVRIEGIKEAKELGSAAVAKKISDNWAASKKANPGKTEWTKEELEKSLGLDKLTDATKFAIFQGITLESPYQLDAIDHFLPSLKEAFDYLLSPDAPFLIKAMLWFV